ncbi:MAG: hypothetical protein AB8B53_04615 [Flavobacteriales bacterium]
MIKNIVLTIFLAFTSCLIYSQETVLERDVEEEREDTEVDRFKNQFRFGVNLSLEDDVNLGTEWNSFSAKYGGMAMFRAAKFYSFGITYGVQADNYRLRQDSLNLLGTGTNVDRQSLHVYTGRLGMRNRFHLGKHGTEEGVYIEVGAEGSIRMTSRMRIQDDIDPKLPSSQGAEEVDQLFRRLQFIELFGYYGTAAIGRNGISLYGEYRLSNLFKKYEFINNNESLPEIAPLNVGVRFEF